MHRLIDTQLAEARRNATGELDIDKLVALVATAYEDAERDRQWLLDAFEMIPEGIAILDKHDRHVLWNRRYAEIYNKSVELCAGASFEGVLRENLRNGQFPEAIGREEEWLAARLARHRLPSNTEIQHLCDNRWVRVEERRTADGGSIGVRVDITELKQREESFRLLFEGNPLPMLVCEHKKLNIIAVNDAALDHYGYSRQQFLSMTVFDLRPPEDRDELQQMLDTRVPARHSGAARRHVKADGTIIDVAVYSRQLRYDGQGATLFTVIDMTARLRAEDDLRATREFLNTVIENVPVAVTVKDASTFRYLLVNDAAEKFLGMPRDQIIGKSVYDMYPPNIADAITARDQALLVNGTEIVLGDRPFHGDSNGIRNINTRRRTVADAAGRPRYLLGVVEDITELKSAEERIAHLASHDSLTDLPNRAAFDRHITEALDYAQSMGDEFSVIYLDLDRFKAINDVFGHTAGDVVLQETARRLDVARGDGFLARFGGDEFTLIMPGGPDAAEELAERLQAAMVEPIETEGNRFTVGLSVGVALYPLDGADAKTLLSNADAALYRAKADGRGNIRFFEAEMDQQLRERRAMQHELRSAAERGELSLHYQPQANMHAEIIGFEVLTRWTHPRLGSVPPATFIPLAEDSGIIITIGEWILREACREAASWSRPLQVAVNLSPIQFQHGDLPELVHQILLETGLAAHRLELEITEGVLMHDFAQAVSILRRLKNLGVRIAMDDFGTGYSSLSYLQSFPFDKIKIDKSFIASLKRSPQSAAIIRAVIGLGRGLDLPVAAEGVETQDQFDFLSQEACSEIQGFLVGRPQPIEAYAGIVGGEDQAQLPISRVVAQAG